MRQLPGAKRKKKIAKKKRNRKEIEAVSCSELNVFKIEISYFNAFFLA